MKKLDVLIALMVPTLWGMGLVVAKPAVDQFPPILLMAMRFGYGHWFWWRLSARPCNTG